MHSRIHLFFFSFLKKCPHLLQSSLGILLCARNGLFCNEVKVPSLAARASVCMQFETDEKFECLQKFLVPGLLSSPLEVKEGGHSGLCLCMCVIRNPGEH